MAKIAINIATGSLQQEEIIVGIDLGHYQQPGGHHTSDSKNGLH